MASRPGSTRFRLGHAPGPGKRRGLAFAQPDRRLCRLCRHDCEGLWRPGEKLDHPERNLLFHLDGIRRIRQSSRPQRKRAGGESNLSPCDSLLLHYQVQARQTANTAGRNARVGLTDNSYRDDSAGRRDKEDIAAAWGAAPVRPGQTPASSSPFIAAVPKPIICAPRGGARPNAEKWRSRSDQSSRPISWGLNVYTGGFTRSTRGRLPEAVLLHAELIQGPKARGSISVPDANVLGTSLRPEIYGAEGDLHHRKWRRLPSTLSSSGTARCFDLALGSPQLRARLSEGTSIFLRSSRERVPVWMAIFSGRSSGTTLSGSTATTAASGFATTISRPRNARPSSAPFGTAASWLKTGSSSLYFCGTKERRMGVTNRGGLIGRGQETGGLVNLEDGDPIIPLPCSTGPSSGWTDGKTAANSPPTGRSGRGSAITSEATVKTEITSVPRFKTQSHLPEG